MRRSNRKKSTTPGEHDGDGLFMAADRREMAAKLRELLPMARAVGAEDVLRVADALLALLEAPAPLPKKRALPLLAALDGRMEKLFERAAAETTGADQARMREGAEQAREGEAFFAAAVREDEDGLN